MSYIGKKNGNPNTDFLEAGGELENHDLVTVDGSGNVTATSYSGDGSALTGIESLPDAIDVDASAPADSLAIDSNGKVGVGTTSPSSYYAKHLVVDTGSSLQSGITIVNDTGYQGMLAFADGTTGNARYRGFLDYNHSNDSLAFGSAGSERMRINDGGDLIVGTSATTSTEKLKVYSSGDACYFQCASGGEEAVNIHRSAAQGTFVAFINNNGAGCGSINNASGVNNVTYSTSSDYRLKENVVDMVNAIDRVKALQPKRFSWIDQELDSANTDGFLAHEVSSIIPEAVTGTKDAVEVWEEWEELPEGVSVGDNKTDEDGNTIPVYQGIDLAKLTPLLTGALQEAITKIETLETTVADLTTRLEVLENA